MRIKRRTALQLTAIAAASSTGLSWASDNAAPASSPGGETGGQSDPLVDLAMEFTGMLLFASREGAALPQLGQVHALLVNTSKLSSGKYDPHRPLLKVRKDDVLQHDPADDDRDGELTFGLMDHDVSLRIDGKQPTGPALAEAKVATANKPLKLTPPYDAPWSDIAFIANLSGILGKTAVVHPDFVASTLAAGSKVAARVTLADGTFRGIAPTCAWGRHIAWGYSDPMPQSNYRQVVTDIVEFRPPKAKQIQLVLKNRGTSATRTITLKPGAVRVRVQNTIDMPMQCDSPAHCKPGDAGCPPHHFRAYYELLEQSDPGHFPTPGPTFLAGTDTQLKNTDPPVYCPPPIAKYKGA